MARALAGAGRPGLAPGREVRVGWGSWVGWGWCVGWGSWVGRVGMWAGLLVCGLGFLGGLGLEVGEGDGWFR
jgi:hypothetical protein